MDAKFRKKIDAYYDSFLRKIFHWSPAYKAVLKRCFVKKVGKTEYYKCEKDSKVIPRSEKHVDHIVPYVDPEKGPSADWNERRDRMLVDPDQLQLLCKKTCHKEKTDGENKLRRQRKTT